MNLYREGTLCVSKRTLRRLRWLRSAGVADQYRKRDIGEPDGLSRQFSLDDIAEGLLDEYMEQKWPQLKEVEEGFKHAEKIAIDILSASRDTPALS